MCKSSLLKPKDLFPVSNDYGSGVTGQTIIEHNNTLHIYRSRTTWNRNLALGVRRLGRIAHTVKILNEDFVVAGHNITRIDPAFAES